MRNILYSFLKNNKNRSWFKLYVFKEGRGLFCLGYDEIGKFGRVVKEGVKCMFEFIFMWLFLRDEIVKKNL